jgi:ABC-2 type transport system ATP-binding protein
LIQVDHLTKRYGLFTAVDDLSFSVERGEVLGFLGPNGAGKTTTMRILTGYLPPTGGTLSVSGHDIQDEPLAAKRRIGYLPEGVPIYPEMYVADYLSFAAELKGIPRRERAAAIDAAMAVTDILDRRTRVIGHLSKGLKKRVGIAQALLGEPDVLILDEPTEGLDPNQVVSIRDLINSLAGERTIIVSTHILSEVEQTCKRVLIIDDGRVVASDSVEHIRATVGGDSIVLNVEVVGTWGALHVALEGFDAQRADPDVVDAGHARARVIVGGLDAVPEVASRVVGAGLGLVELNRERASLEDVFLRLTSGRSRSGGGEA